MPKCSQCPNEAMYNVYGHPLCLNCFYKIQQIQQARNTELRAMINYVSDQIDYTAGLTNIPPRLEVPQPIVQNVPIRYNHIKIDNSVVGAISTGDAAKIDVSLSHIYLSGNKDLCEVISQFTNQLIVDKKLQAQSRQEILEQLAFVTEQLARPTTKKSVIWPIIESIGNKLSTIVNLATAWEKVSRLIEPLLS